jgi:hypothetical protein
VRSGEPSLQRSSVLQGANGCVPKSQLRLLAVSRRLYRHSWPPRAASRSATFEYIEGFYNRERRHTTLGNLSPTALRIPARRSVLGLANVSVKPGHAQRLWPGHPLARLPLDDLSPCHV